MYVYRNIEARSCCQCCCGKAMSITYCECVFVALVIQHTMRMRRIVLPWSAPLYDIFPHYLINGMIFEGKLPNKMCVLALLLHRAFRRITSIINQQLHLHKFHIKTLKITPTCFDLF